MMTVVTTTDTPFYDDSGKFSAKKFIEYLDTEGRNVPYDREKPEKGQLPLYYDEVKFKKAQLVFEKYKSCFLLVKLTGLLALLLNAVALKIIMLTKKSGTPETAFVRYRDTFRHVLIWYSSDFTVGSKLWKSIDKVKSMHHSANLEATTVPNVLLITQRELAATVWGFIGFAIARPEYFGLKDLADSELEAVVHFWRVICYLLGVDNRFNLCRESLAQTKAIFHEVTNHYFKRFMLLRQPNSEHMQLVALEGIRKFGFILKPKVVLNMLNDVILMDRVKYYWLYYDMNFIERVYDVVLRLTIKLMRYRWFRNIANVHITRKINRLFK
ncbi:hypothetical protein Trydic_g11824 [Trypoxylus dichotomus]